MSNPKVENMQKPSASKHSEPYKTEPVRIFSEDQIRTRAYQIYESGDRNSNNPAADWSQAETELMELLHAK
jgi:Protein of unknown function (DUF2934)